MPRAWHPRKRRETECLRHRAITYLGDICAEGLVVSRASDGAPHQGADICNDSARDEGVRHIGDSVRQSNACYSRFEQQQVKKVAESDINEESTSILEGDAGIMPCGNKE